MNQKKEQPRKSSQTTIPIRLLSEGNNNDHWTKKHKRRKMQQQWTSVFWRRDIGNIKPPVAITLVRQAPRTLDGDNLQTAFKWIRDAIADLIIPGLKPGRADNLEGLTFHYDQEKSKEYGVKVIVEKNPDALG